MDCWDPSLEKFWIVDYQVFLLIEYNHWHRRNSLFWTWFVQVIKKSQYLHVGLCQFQNLGTWWWCRMHNYINWWCRKWWWMILPQRDIQGVAICTHQAGHATPHTMGITLTIIVTRRIALVLSVYVVLFSWGEWIALQERQPCPNCFSLPSQLGPRIFSWVSNSFKRRLLLRRDLVDRQANTKPQKLSPFNKMAGNLASLSIPFKQFVVLIHLPRA